MEFLLDNGFESYFDDVAHANGRTGLSIGADLLFSRDQSAFKEFSSKYAKYLNSSIVERLEESTSISELSRLLIGGSQQKYYRKIYNFCLILGILRDSETRKKEIKLRAELEAVAIADEIRLVLNS